MIYVWNEYQWRGQLKLFHSRKKCELSVPNITQLSSFIDFLGVKTYVLPMILDSLLVFVDRFWIFSSCCSLKSTKTNLSSSGWSPLPFSPWQPAWCSWDSAKHGGSHAGRWEWWDRLWVRSPNGSQKTQNWLVVWNTFYFPYIWNSHRYWLIFFRGVEITNQKSMCDDCALDAGPSGFWWGPRGKV